MGDQDTPYGTSGSSRSPANIANWIATNSQLAVSTQFSLDYHPLFYRRHYRKKVETHLASQSLFYKPVFELSMRGVMIERGLIDLDEIDMGWIISESIMQTKDWHSGDPLNLGKLFLFAPIVSATGYLISERDIQDNFIDYRLLPEIIEIILDNTTPEDTVNLYKALFNVDNYFELDLLESNYSLNEQIEDLLEAEINLLDFFNHYAETYLSFQEISSYYQISFSEGISAFLETINENRSYSDAILHTYISLMSIYPDSHILNRFNRVKAFTLRKKAKEVINHGSIFTEDGQNEIKELINLIETELNGVRAYTIEDLTTTVTLIASLSGFRP